MNHEKNLTKKQLEIIDELFAGELSEQDIGKKNAVSKTQYRKWLTDAAFQSELKSRLDRLNLQSRVLIARNCSLAAAKLIALIESDKEETARKACLDILSLCSDNNKKTNNSEDAAQNPELPTPNKLPPATAAKLLEFLANN